MEDINKLQVNFKHAVLPHLKEGLTVLDTLTNKILTVDPNNMQSCHDSIRTLIIEVLKHVSLAEESGKKEVAVIDDKCIKLNIQSSNLKEEQRLKETELKSHQSKLENWRQMEDASQRRLGDEEQQLHEMQKRAEENKKKRDAGIGLMFIPIIGPIIGSVLLAESVPGLAEAEQRVNEIRGNIDHYRNEAHRFSSEINRVHYEIRSVLERSAEIESTLVRLNELKINMADIQKKMRLCAEFVGILSGRVTVVEVQTRKIIVLEPLLCNMEQIINHLFQIPSKEDNAYLNENEIKKVIENLKVSNKKIKQLTETDDRKSQFISVLLKKCIAINALHCIK
ncbi:uncharacterized protein LOC122792479 [Protopterus annectens]|uniref:uncharacterized protein LOC122792479 n=1 Tax=Protopterus annectens TaxID=7888 RepID=UPI001CFC38A5|nr:uncharacterized protein LOC122792479 [Protopterus annectens]